MFLEEAYTPGRETRSRWRMEGVVREHWGGSGALSRLLSLMKLCFLCCLRREGKGTRSAMFLDFLCTDCFFTGLRQTAVTCRGSGPLALTL